LYERWLQEKGLPVRCENPECQFYTHRRVWCGKTLPLILDHINGVPGENRIENLQFLCPNCDSLLSETRGGANKGQRIPHTGGFQKKRKDEKWTHTMPADAAIYKVRS